MSKIEAEVYALSTMNTALRELSEDVPSTFEQVERAIISEKSRLEEIKRQRDQIFKQCRAAYQACRSCTDEDGYPPPCTAEWQALEEATQKLAEVEVQIKVFNDQADAYSDQASRLKDSVEGSIREARKDLEKHIDTGLYYLRNHPDEIGTISGAGTHGALYQGSRREFFRRVAAGEFAQENPEHQVWVRNQVNQGGYYRSPPYYHTAHRVAGIDIPENFYFEYWEDNILRARTAALEGLPWPYR